MFTSTILVNGKALPPQDTSFGKITPYQKGQPIHFQKSDISATFNGTSPGRDELGEHVDYNFEIHSDQTNISLKVCDFYYITAIDFEIGDVEYFLQLISNNQFVVWNDIDDAIKHNHPHYNPDAQKDEQLTPKESTETRHSKIYYFQHRVLPAILFESGGKVFADLKNGKKSKVLEIAEEVVDSDFSDAIQIKPVSNEKAYTILFQKPEAPPECYFVLIINTGDDYSYYTLERSIDLFGTGVPKVLGKIEAEGRHINFGNREYDDLKSFVEDVLKMQKKANQRVDLTVKTPVD